MVYIPPIDGRFLDPLRFHFGTCLQVFIHDAHDEHFCMHFVLLLLLSGPSAKFAPIFTNVGFPQPRQHAAFTCSIFGVLGLLTNLHTLRRISCSRNLCPCRPAGSGAHNLSSAARQSRVQRGSGHPSCIRGRLGYLQGRVFHGGLKTVRRGG